MQNIIRRDDYVNEYLSIVYDKYNKVNNPYFVDYYRLDKENSIYDEHYGEAYEKVGDLSGLKWNKILKVPIFTVDPITPQLNHDEKGINISDSGSGTGIISPEVGFTPRSGDMFATRIDNDLSFFLITGISTSSNMPFNKTYTRFSFSLKRWTHEKILKQVNGIYMYVEPIHTILPLNYADLIIKVIFLIQDYINKLFQNFYNEKLDVFFTKKESDIYYIVDQDINFVFLKYVYPNISNLLTDVYNFDFNIDFELPDEHFYNLLFNNAINITYSKTCSKVNDNILLNKNRVRIYKNIDIYSLDNSSSTHFLSLYYDSSLIPDIEFAIDKLFDFKMNGIVDYEHISETSNLSKFIKYYIMSNNDQPIDVMYPIVIDYMFSIDSSLNLIEIVYGLHLLTGLYNNLIVKNVEFE